MNIINNKAFSTIWIMVILVALIGGGVLVWNYSGIQNNDNEVNEEVSEDETADWKTYKNKKYEYTMKYPSNLEIFEKEQGGYVEIGLVLINFSIKIKENISSLEELKLLEEEILENTGLSNADLKISWKDKTFLELPAKELSFKGFAGGEPMISRTYVIKDNNAYILSSGNAENFDEYYQILSTFRFIESEDETADWETYKNEEYGFEIKYPDDYYIDVSGKREEGDIIYDLLRVAIYEEPKTTLININVTGPDFRLGTRDWENFTLGEIDGSISYNWENWEIREKVSSAEIIFISENKQNFYITTRSNPLEDKIINQMLSTFRFLE